MATDLVLGTATRSPVRRSCGSWHREPTAHPGPRLGLHQKLLVAAWLRYGRLDFSNEQLAVAAWEYDPAAFGLRGFEHAHPNLNLVMAKLCGPTGLTGRGLIERAAGGLRLTPRGCDVAAWLRDPNSPAPDFGPPVPKLPPAGRYYPLIADALAARAARLAGAAPAPPPRPDSQT